jgi:hypothetical protein
VNRQPYHKLPEIQPVDSDGEVVEDSRPMNGTDLDTNAIRESDQWHTGVTLLAIVTILAVVLRIVACFELADGIQADPDAYRAIAVTLQQTGTFGLLEADGTARPTAFRPPLYPWLLSWLVRDGALPWVSVVAFHSLLGGMTAVWSSLIGQRLIGPIGVVAGIFVALDPILLNQSTVIMTETLAAMIVTGGLWWWVTRYDSSRKVAFGIGLGLFLALAYLCRPTFMPWALLVVGASLFCGAPLKSRVTSTLTASVIIVVVTICWMIRNDRWLGRPIWGTTHGGYTLLLANNPCYYDYLRSRAFEEMWNPQLFFDGWMHRYDGDITQRSFWSVENLVQLANQSPTYPPGTKEQDDDDLATAAAKATIRDQPVMFLWSCIVRLGQFWSPLPHSTLDRGRTQVWLVGVYYMLMFLLVARGAIRLGRKMLGPQWWAMWLIVLTLSGIHAVYFSNMRMRAPLIAVLAVLATAGLTPRYRVEPSQENSAAYRG